MPYIDKDKRKAVDLHIDALALSMAVAAKDPDSMKGMSNYVLCSLLVKVFKGHELRYTKIADMIGALECAKLELYRRVAAPYENGAIARNGDIDVFGV